ncbi:MAG: hypothetical protein QW102_03885 [Candidatus Nezhaarchaeales archaeon]
MSELLNRLEHLNGDETEKLTKGIKGVVNYSAQCNVSTSPSQRRYGSLPLGKWLKRLAKEIYGIRGGEGILRLSEEGDVS